MKKGSSTTQCYKSNPNPDSSKQFGNVILKRKLNRFKEITSHRTRGLTLAWKFSTGRDVRRRLLVLAVLELRRFLNVLLPDANETFASISDGLSAKGNITNLVRSSPEKAAKFIRIYLRSPWVSPPIVLSKTFVIRRQTAKT